MSEIERDISARRIHYAGKLTDYLSLYPQTFREFIGNQKIIEFGDKLLSEGLTTGYNFATNEQFPVTSTDPLIFYSVYAQRVNHFGELLARMEDEEITKEEDVTFGIKAAKITGDYPDPELVVSSVKMKGGYSRKTLESVEAVAIFHPTWLGQSLDILKFLLSTAPKIEGGYEDPDTRATSTEGQKQLFVRSGLLKLARANIFKFEEGNLITLRQNTPFDDKGWQSFFGLINPELYEYLTSVEVAA